MTGEMCHWLFSRGDKYSTVADSVGVSVCAADVPKLNYSVRLRDRDKHVLLTLADESEGGHREFFAGGHNWDVLGACVVGSVYVRAMCVGNCGYGREVSIVLVPLVCWAHKALLAHLIEHSPRSVPLSSGSRSITWHCTFCYSCWAISDLLSAEIHHGLCFNS
jgi:hypothetical protein